MKTIESILLGCSVLNRDENTFEDAKVYDDIPFFVKVIHKYLVKPISKYGSSDILKREILSAVGDTKNKKIIDVSVGDDETILSLCNGAKKAVANDLVDSTMDGLRGKSNTLTFTNKNILDLNGKEKYDVVLCKNTLHHLNTPKQIEKALNKLKQITAKKGVIILMDIEKPSLSLRARLWNAYYVFMLKDQGGFFISYSQFRDIVSITFNEFSYQFKKVETIKGHYMFAKITK